MKEISELIGRKFILNYELLPNGDTFKYEYNINGNIVFTIESNEKLYRGDLVKCINVDEDINYFKVEKLDNIHDKNLPTLVNIMSRVKFNKKFTTIDVYSKFDSDIFKCEFLKLKNYKILYCLVLDKNRFNHYYFKIDKYFDYKISLITKEDKK